MYAYIIIKRKRCPLNMVYARLKFLINLFWDTAVHMIVDSRFLDNELGSPQTRKQNQVDDPQHRESKHSKHKMKQMHHLSFVNKIRS